MTLKIGNSQSSGDFPANFTEKTEKEKLLSNSAAENEAAINFLANQNPSAKINLSVSGDGDKKTVGDFLRKVRAEQPFDEKAMAAKKISIFINPKKPTVAEYDKATWRAIFQKAGYGMLTDQEIALAVGGMNAVGWRVNDTGFSEANIRANDAKSSVSITTTQGLIEKAKRAGQAVLQYQEYEANRRDAAIEKGKDYVNGAIGGFVQVPINGAANIVNGLSEPLRAGEKIVFGTNYVPEVSKLKIAENSEYWNKDGRMYANKGGEIAATIVFGGMVGSKAIATQAGRTIIGIESTYNIGAGLAGKDVTQTDANGNARQMEWLERGTRIAGGLFGARQTVKTEISTPNSITNEAVNNLDDVFKNPPTFKSQTEKDLDGLPKLSTLQPAKNINSSEEVVKIANNTQTQSKYFTKEMLQEYVGEETGSVWGTKVKYLNEIERAKLELFVKNGKIFDKNGNLFDTSSASSVFGAGQGKAIFVMDNQGRIYASTYQSVGKFHHSSILGGKPVAAAGEITVKNGKIVEISNRSGHYQPSQQVNSQIIKELKNKGVNTSNIKITGF